MWPWPLRCKPVPEALSAEVALAMQELDEYLGREHELVEELGTPRDIGGLLQSFANRCERVALVGSYRRCVPEPNDIDVLHIPKNRMQAMEFIEKVADDEAMIKQLGGNGGWTCAIRGRKVDFIQSSAATWGIDVIQFTGSREFNQRLERHAARRGYKITDGKVTTEKNDGYHSYNASAFYSWTEEKILTHLGLEEFLDPRRR